MDTKVNYVVVGIFVVALTFATAVATIWIAGGHHSKQYNTYVTYVNEPVDGVTEKSTVKFNGVDVGYVDAVTLNPNNPQEVRLALKIVEGTPINQSTVATIRSQGITGYTYIGLHAMKKSAPPLLKPLNEPFPIIPYSASLFKQLDTIAQDVSKNINSVTTALSELLGSENQKSVRQILENIEQMTNTIEQNSDNLDKSLKSTDKLLKNTAEASEEFQDTVKELNLLLKDAQGAAKNVSKLAADGRRTLKKGDRAINDFTDQTLPKAYTTMTKLKHVMANIESLTDELQRNPSMLVRGKHQDPAGPGE